MLFLLTLMIFVVTLALTMSAIYFFVEVPAAKKRMYARLEAIQQASVSPLVDPEADLLRDEVLSQLPAFNRILLQIPLANRMQLFVQQADLKINVAMLLLISFSLGFFSFLATWLVGLPGLFILLITIGAGAVPFSVVSFIRQRRFAKFEEQFPDSIEMLARAVRAGHAFTTGLELIAQEMPDPIATEFRVTYEQQNFGMPIKEALHNLTVRMPLPDVRFFASALQIQRESGGNLAEILDNLSLVIRDRFKILRQVKVFTAQGRMTLYILMGLAPGFGLLMYMRNPEYIVRLFTDPLGRTAVGLGVVLQVIGFFIIRKIIRIKV